jgi:multiple sugar transport system substrate-binding protein
LSVLAAKGLVEDVTWIWDKHIRNEEYDPALKELFSYKGRAYGTFWAIATWGMMWYNPKTFKSLGIEGPPKFGITWDELLALAEKLKNKGVKWPIYEPFVSWTGFPWLQQLLASTDPDFYNKLMIGQASYTDPQALFALETFADLVKRGYFGDVAAGAAPGYTMYPPPPQWENWWTSGQVGMILNGDWISETLPNLKKDGTDYNFFWFPPLKPIGNIAILEASPFCISKNAPEQLKKYGMQVLDFFMTPQAQLIWDTKYMPQRFSNKKLPIDKMTPIHREIFEVLNRGQWRYLIRFWEATAPGIASEISNLMDKIAFEPDKWREVAQQMDDFATRYWKENLLP